MLGGNQMRGSLVCRNGHYSAIIEDKDELTGKRKRKWISLKGNKKECERQLNEIVNQKDKGVFIVPGKVTVSDYLTSWIKDYSSNLSPATAQGYQHIIESHLKPTIGSLVLTKLKCDRIQRYITDKLANGRQDQPGGLSPRTVKHHIVCLHTALSRAVKQGLIMANPVDSVTLPRPSRTEMHTMNESDIHILLEFAKSEKYVLYYGLFYLLIFTGLRRSEALALRWQDIDLTLMQLSVTRSLHHTKGGGIVFRQPKTEKSRRLISLSPSTVNVLIEHREAQLTLRQSLNLTLDQLVWPKN
jgi:integrase